MLLLTFVLAILLNLSVFLVAFKRQTDTLTDITYASTFFLVSLFVIAMGPVTLSSILLLIMITLWAIRLGSYLFIRIHKIGKDKRFDGMRESFWRFLRFWLLQGVSVWIILVPSILFLSKPPASLSIMIWIGMGVWALGLALETVADFQKYRFINTPNNKGKWIDIGLWHYSRHPNYFGEMMHWLGIYLFTLAGLSTTQAVIGIIGPLYIILLISFISGIPLLENAADKRWGTNKQYQSYKRRTSVLIPLPPKRVQPSSTNSYPT